MAEDSQYKGELWNKRAIKLLNLFSWDMIGDSGMDLEGSDGEKYGIDSLYSFKDPAKDIPESLILEAKSYKTTSFSKSKLQEWIDRLNIKILELRNSEYLIERFPIFKDISTLKIGLIFIWFDDIENYKEYRQKFLEILSEIKVSSRTFRNGVYNKIYVIDNDLISKLCSLYTVVREFNENFKFYYPSAFIHERAVQRRINRQLNENATITIETIMSISKQFSNVSMDWLINGTGEMLLDEATKKDVPTSSSDSDKDEEIRNLKEEIIRLGKEVSYLEGKISVLIDDRTPRENDEQEGESA